MTTAMVTKPRPRSELNKSKTEVVTVDNELEGLTTEQLYEAFDVARVVTCKQIQRMASIVRLLEERGEDLSEIKQASLQSYRLIGQGQLLPEVFQLYCGSPLLFNRIRTYPLSEQRKLASDAPMRILSADNPAEDCRIVKPSVMTRDEVHQAFAENHIRTDGEQRSWLERLVSRVKRKTKERPDIILEKKKRGITVSAGGQSVFISSTDMHNYLMELGK